MTASQATAVSGKHDASESRLAQSGARPRFGAAVLPYVGILQGADAGCAAVLVGPRTVLASATSVRAAGAMSSLSFKVMAANGSVSTVRAKEVTTHPRFMPSDPFSIDLALVTLEAAIPGPYATPYIGPLAIGARVIAVGLGDDDSRANPRGSVLGQVTLEYEGAVPFAQMPPGGLASSGLGRELTAFVSAGDALPCLSPGGGPVIAYHPVNGPQLLGIASVLFPDAHDDSSDVEVWCVPFALHARWVEQHALLSAPASSERFVRLLLGDVLERAVGTSLITSGAEHLDRGASRLALATEVLRAPERRHKTLLGWFAHFLGRKPSIMEEDHCLGAWDRGVNEDAMLIALASCPEYIERAQAQPGASREERYAIALHRDVFGRKVAPGEVDGWVERLRTGTAFAVVAESLICSDELRATMVRIWHRTLLRRDADAATVASWLSGMRLGRSHEQMMARLLASDAYYDRSF